MIRSGQLRAGERLPSVREMTEGGLRTASARHALAVLTEEGLITSRQGRGSFVAEGEVTSGSARRRRLELLGPGRDQHLDERGHHRHPHGADHPGHYRPGCHRCQPVQRAAGRWDHRHRDRQRVHRGHRGRLRSGCGVVVHGEQRHLDHRDRARRDQRRGGGCDGDYPGRDQVFTLGLNDGTFHAALFEYVN
ncbi:MAG: GntR family transcriptional regulator [Streptosporangiaceae bacterium]